MLSRESSETGEGPTGSGDIGGSSLERSAVVPRSPTDALGFSPVGSSVSGSVSHDLRDSSHEYQPKLAMWPISGENLPVKTFQAKLGISYWLPGEQSPTRLMIPISRNGYAGALQGVQIPFLEL